MKKETALFFVGSLTGWLLDTTYRSIVDGFFSHSSLLTKLSGFIFPFMPVYGFGLVAVYLIMKKYEKKPWPYRAAMYALSLTAIELTTGLIFVKTLGIPLWDYSQAKLNLLGIIDLTHTIYWLILGVLAEQIIKKVHYFQSYTKSASTH